jgi:hypothetical protein
MQKGHAACYVKSDFRTPAQQLTSVITESQNIQDHLHLRRGIPHFCTADFYYHDTAVTTNLSWFIPGGHDTVCGKMDVPQTMLLKTWETQLMRFVDRCSGLDTICVTVTGALIPKRMGRGQACPRGGRIPESRGVPGLSAIPLKLAVSR